MTFPGCPADGCAIPTAPHAVTSWCQTHRGCWGLRGSGRGVTLSLFCLVPRSHSQHLPSLEAQHGVSINQFKLSTSRGVSCSHRTGSATLGIQTLTQRVGEKTLLFQHVQSDGLPHHPPEHRNVPVSIGGHLEQTQPHGKHSSSITSSLGQGDQGAFQGISAHFQAQGRSLLTLCFLPPLAVCTCHLLASCRKENALETPFATTAKQRGWRSSQVKFGHMHQTCTAYISSPIVRVCSLPARLVVNALP